MPEEPDGTTPTRTGRRTKQRRYSRQTALIASFAAAMVAVLVAGGWWFQSERTPETGLSVDPTTYVPPTEIATSSPTTSSSTSTSTSSRTTSSSTALSTKADPATVADGDPARVQVRSGGKDIIDASLVATYLDEAKELAPPFGTAGWYAEQGWPKPGATGASILVGHINEGSNPDVFWNLPKVKVGDIVTVTYGSGDKVQFRITKSEAAGKTEVPKDDTIWDWDNPEPILRLITCDPTTPLNGGHYEGNWVVWADDIVT